MIGWTGLGEQDVMTDAGVSLYLDLLKRCVTNLIYQDPMIRYIGESPEDNPIGPFSLSRRMEGKDWPSQAHTMIGIRRLDNIQTLVEEILEAEVPGDLIEAGVWRGGSTIFMRGILKAYGITNRKVWVADSFAGFPSTEEQGLSPRSLTSPGLNFLREPSLRGHAQARLDLLLQGIKYEEVRERFDRYGLLDDQVQFLCGWFRDTLPSASIERLALMRLDGDLYDSTYDALEALYPRLSIGGYAIVDDYGTFTECRRAVREYLRRIDAEADIKPIDDEAVFWQKRG
jgi:hypothetical protein